MRYILHVIQIGNFVTPSVVFREAEPQEKGSGGRTQPLWGHLQLGPVCALAGVPR